MSREPLIKSPKAKSVFSCGKKGVPEDGKKREAKINFRLDKFF